MKRMLSWMMAGWVMAASAQEPVLPITTDKTSSLVFPHPILHVDRGSRAILVQQVQAAENILLVKAAMAHFPQSNLSVITRDGSVYAFRVCYEKEPTVWVHRLPAQGRKGILEQARDLQDNPPTRNGPQVRKWDMSARVMGIYSAPEVLYFQLEIKNSGPVLFEIDFLRFYLRDRKRVKRTAVQETELVPRHIAGSTDKVAGRVVMVVALEAFTLPDRKEFIIDIGEKRGGRHLQLKLANPHITRAVPLQE